MEVKLNEYLFQIKKAKQLIEGYGKKGLLITLKKLFWQSPLRLFGKYIWNFGSPIFTEEWDVLIILDACRADLMFDTIHEHDIDILKMEKSYSVASHTYEWMKKSFSETFVDSTYETTYITGNPHSEGVLDPDQFENFYEPWRYFRNEFGTVPPRPITDQAIRTMRNDQPERLIVHYMQPHQPFRTFSEIEGPDQWTNYDVWQLLELVEVTRDVVWEGYRDNLDWVLEDLSLLLSNIDAEKVVITSDHGNSFGEWGIYGHPKYVPLPHLKEVPWIELSANDIDSYEPQTNGVRSTNAVSVEETLEALGYKSD